MIFFLKNIFFNYYYKIINIFILKLNFFIDYYNNKNKLLKKKF